jgi:hypothetical protein
MKSPAAMFGYGLGGITSGGGRAALHRDGGLTNPRGGGFGMKPRLGGRSVEQSRRIASEVVEVDGFNIPPVPQK